VSQLLCTIQHPLQTFEIAEPLVLEVLQPSGVGRRGQEINHLSR
jgi:hypothetical protein